MKDILRTHSQGAVWFVIALYALTIIALPLLRMQNVSAAGQVSERSITMSTSAASATGVTYSVSFKAATSTSTAAVLVDFCSSSPIIGDACGAPAGLDLNVTAATLANVSANMISPVEDIVTFAASPGTLLFSFTGFSPSVGDVMSFDITGVDNPSTTNTSFYARVVTYDSLTDAQGYTAANPDVVGAHIDDGGIALSTANQITITAKVQERLTFCVFTNSPANCAAATGSAIALGDDNGILDYSAAHANSNAGFIASTNATNGVDIYMKGTTLTSGANTITAVSPAVNSAIGTEQFGMCADTDGAGAFSIDAAYVPTTGDCGAIATSSTATPYTGLEEFFLDTTATASASGDLLASSAGASQPTEGTLAFLGNIDLVTEAGIYTSTMTFIATGTF